jgi:hypothetical protein
MFYRLEPGTTGYESGAQLAIGPVKLPNITAFSLLQLFYLIFFVNGNIKILEIENVQLLDFLIFY